MIYPTKSIPSTSIPGMLLWVTMALLFTTSVNAQDAGVYNIRSVNDLYSFNYYQSPSTLVSANSSSEAGASFVWQSSTRADEAYFIDLVGYYSANYTPSVLSATTWFRRKTIKGGITYYSNIVKYELVSTRWEDRNYIREHVVLTPNITSWTAVDQLPIGSKLQTTGYIDGVGRTTQTVAREMATPASGGGAWGDIVSFGEFDKLGRSPKGYLPYTVTAVSPGAYQSNAKTDQAGYYLAKHNDTKPYSEVQYEASPLQRVTEAKAPGNAWNLAQGEKAKLLMNFNDDVKIWAIGTANTDMPVNTSGLVYNNGTLAKYENTDVNGFKTYSFIDGNGNIILKKTEIDPTAANNYQSWLQTYYVYDGLGRLRCEIQPEGVYWLSQNSWNFNYTNGTTVFAEQCFVYNYDYKNRLIYKKTPGVAYLQMVYDNRNRLVFAQDGVQRGKYPAEWSATLYDDLDRPVTSAIFYTTESLAQMQNRAITAAPLSPGELANSSICTVTGNTYYDHYSFTGVTAFDNTSAANAAIVPAAPDILPIITDPRTTGMVTGSRTLVLETSTYLSATLYYDQDGNALQTITDNIKGGKDISTAQYSWDGRLVASYMVHGMPGHAMNGFTISTKYDFDNIKRVTATYKKWGSNAWKKINEYSFDDLGRAKDKVLVPGYTELRSDNSYVSKGKLESLAYSYNVQGMLTGINKDYALKKNGVGNSFDKWGNFFGVYYAYDKNEIDGGATTRLNGQMAAQAWVSQGDDAQRRYQYQYDKANRLTLAGFTQKANPNDAWSAATLNFSEQLQYDLNGNIKNLDRYGFVFTNTVPVLVDQLQYTYRAFSNKLAKVTDAGNAGAGNGTQGDFKDGDNGATDDYDYDVNGNLVKDENKNIKNLGGTNGIRYNHLDKPVEIKIDGKGTIRYTYTAGGGRVKREFISSLGLGTKITWYCGAFEYTEIQGGSNPQAFQLESVHFEEGRLRAITNSDVNINGLGYERYVQKGNIPLPTGQVGSIDYFITDSRSDIRMMLTEETQWSQATATIEYYAPGTGYYRPTTEEQYFTRVSDNRTGTPAAWTGNNSSYVSQLFHPVSMGPGRLLRVMAGDEISLSVNYYTPAGTSSSTNTYSSLISSLISIINSSGAVPAGAKAGSGTISSSLSASTALQNFTNPYYSGGMVSGQMVLLFFDERFNFVTEGSNIVPINSGYAGNGWAPPLSLVGVKAPKNGYCIAYVYNGGSQPVYFDDFKVKQEHGRIVEENHYYAFGLKMGGLSSRAYAYKPHTGMQPGYQGGYNDQDEETGWNEFALRSYDPQLGRFIQADPFDEFPNPYTGMGNDPVNLVDPSGGSVTDPIELAEVIVYASRAATQTMNATQMIASAISLAGHAEATINIMSAVSSVEDGPGREDRRRMKRANKWARSEYGESARISYDKKGKLRLNYADEDAKDVTLVSLGIEDGDKFLEEFSTWNRIKRLGNLAIDIMPIVGDIKGGAEAGAGKDIFGDELSGLDRGLSAAPLVGKVKKVGKVLRIRKVLNASARIQRYSKALRKAAAAKKVTPITKNSVIEGYKVSNHAWRKSGLGRGATEELVGDVITGANEAGTVIIEIGTGEFSGNVIKVFNHNGVKVAVDETRQLIMSIRPDAGFKLP